jgi:glycine C-acetyltransferase
MATRSFLRFNSNSYLGLSFLPELIEAEEEGVRAFGAGPGAVRFISGTYAAHRDLEPGSRRSTGARRP